MRATLAAALMWTALWVAPAHAFLFQGLSDYGAFDASGYSGCAAVDVATVSGHVLGRCSTWFEAVAIRSEPGSHGVLTVSGEAFTEPQAIESNGTRVLSKTRTHLADLLPDVVLHDESGVLVNVPAPSAYAFITSDSPPDVYRAFLSDGGNVRVGSWLTSNGSIGTWSDGSHGFPVISDSAFDRDGCDHVIFTGLSPNGLRAAFEASACYDAYDQPLPSFNGVMSTNGSLPNPGLAEIRAFSRFGDVWVGRDSTGFAARVEAGVVASLGELDVGETSSLGLDASGDGGVIVGRAETPSGPVAFIWDEASGLRTLESEIAALGGDTTGWQLEEAVAISRDGRIIAGNGVDPTGFRDGFVVRLDDAPLPVPVPSGGVGLHALLRAVLVGVGVVVLARARVVRA